MARTPLVLRAERSPITRGDMRTRSLALLIVSALGVGIGSAWAVLGERPPLGALQIGAWQSFPRIGSADVDPYSRAILARGPHMPLASGEGVQFVARVDDAGWALTGACRYRVAGVTLPSRGWTLTAADRSDRALTGPAAASLGDGDIVASEQGAISITVAARVSSGNWLRVPASGRFALILRFYDTPSSSGVAQLSAAALPRIERVSCG
jgi:hypothetical protein